MKRFHLTLAAILAFLPSAQAQIAGGPPATPSYTDAQAQAAAAAAGYLTSAQVTAMANSAVAAALAPPLISMAGGRAPSTIYELTNNVTATSTSDTDCLPTTGSVSANVAGPIVPAYTGSVPYVGNTFRLLCRGVYTIGITIATATIKVKIGSVVIASQTTASLPIGTSNYPFLIDLVCTVRSVGATATSGTMVCNGYDQFWTTLTTSAPPVPISSGPTPVVFDDTVAQKFGITAALSTIAGSPSVTATQGSVEILY